MNSTLKQHLLIEVMGLQRRRLSPKKLCMLFLSYRDFVDAFTLAFRYRCEVEHNWPCGFEFWIRAPCGIVFVFDKKVHIPTLLRIAGRLTRRLEVCVYKHAWMEPFLEGIDENQHMEFIHFRAGLHFLERYLRHHDNHLPTLECNRFSLLDELGDPYIDKLIVSAKPDDKMKKRCRVENVEVKCSVTSTIWQSIVVCGRLLKVDPKVLKGLTVHGWISRETAYRMITVTYLNLERLQLDNVRTHWMSSVMEEYHDVLNCINNDVVSLKDAMHDHPGTVSVKAFYTGDTTSSLGPTLADIFRTTLTGFTVKVVENFQGAVTKIVCELQWNEGSDFLKVHVEMCSIVNDF